MTPHSGSGLANSRTGRRHVGHPAGISTGSARATARSGTWLGIGAIR